MTPKVPNEILQQTVDVLQQCRGNQTKAAEALDISRAGLQNRLRQAVRLGIVAGQEPPPEPIPEPPPPPSRDVEIEALRKQLREAQAGAAIQEWAKAIIMRADELALERGPAPWLREHIATPGAAGIPTLLLSDLHWGEVVRSEELGFDNDYDMPEARRRLQMVTEKTAELLRDHVVGTTLGSSFASAGTSFPVQYTTS